MEVRPGLPGTRAAVPSSPTAEDALRDRPPSLPTPFGRAGGRGAPAGAGGGRGQGPAANVTDLGPGRPPPPPQRRARGGSGTRTGVWGLLGGAVGSAEPAPRYSGKFLTPPVPAPRPMRSGDT